MGQNGKITVGIVAVCTAAVLGAIGMCAMERVQTASFIGMVAAGLSVIGLYFAFESWKEKPEPKKAAAEPASVSNVSAQTQEAEEPATSEARQDVPESEAQK